MSSSHSSAFNLWALTEQPKFEVSLNGERDSLLTPLRAEALARLGKDGLPTAKNERWLYTDLSELSKRHFTPHKNICIDYHATDNAGLKIIHLSHLMKEKSSPVVKEILNLLKSHSLNEHDPIVSLNTAFLSDGLVIHLEEGSQVENLKLRHQANSVVDNALYNPRVFVILEEGASLTLIEEFTDKFSLSLPITQVVVKNNARFEHIKVVSPCSEQIHLGMLNVEVGREAHFKSLSVSIAGKKVRNSVVTRLTGQRSEVFLAGVTLTDSERHVDNETILEHQAAHCNSRQLFKGLHSATSSAAFSGTIIVAPAAQKTNAIQSNQSILLSEQAIVNTRPQLKIWADDVKCTHGATVGQIDKEALFYLRSRGINKEEARQILAQAFIAEVFTELQLNSTLEELLKLEIENVLSSYN
jgi:Fe-S cluster assembly protein SufD